jgi:hypothetical protein
MVGVVLLGVLCGVATWVERETSASAIVRIVVVGPAPLSVAVDERSGHAFVLSRSMDSPDAASVSMIDTVTPNARWPDQGLKRQQQVGARRPVRCASARRAHPFPNGLG